MFLVQKNEHGSGPAQPETFKFKEEGKRVAARAEFFVVSD
jgi:hypothetical protein